MVDRAVAEHAVYFENYAIASRDLPVGVSYLLMKMLCCTGVHGVLHYEL